MPVLRAPNLLYSANEKPRYSPKARALGENPGGVFRVCILSDQAEQLRKKLQGILVDDKHAENRYKPEGSELLVQFGDKTHGLDVAFPTGDISLDGKTHGLDVAFQTGDISLDVALAVNANIESRVVRFDRTEAGYVKVIELGLRHGALLEEKKEGARPRGSRNSPWGG